MYIKLRNKLLAFFVGLIMLIELIFSPLTESIVMAQEKETLNVQASISGVSLTDSSGIAFAEDNLAGAGMKFKLVLDLNLPIGQSETEIMINIVMPAGVMLDTVSGTLSSGFGAYSVDENGAQLAITFTNQSGADESVELILSDSLELMGFFTSNAGDYVSQGIMTLSFDDISSTVINVPFAETAVTSPQLTLRTNGIWGGSGSETDPYIISDETDLNLLASKVNGGNTYSGSFFKLGQNIELNGTSWARIGNSGTNYFAGVFDGAECTISGFGGNSSTSYYGLFGVINGGTVKNLNIELDKDLSGTERVGVLAGYVINNSIIEKCTVDGRGWTVSAGTYAGGLVGYAYSTNSTAAVVISNCAVKNVSTYTSGNYSAGFVGIAHGYVTIKDCSVTYTDSNSNSADIYAGGFAGAARGTAAFDNCQVYGGNIQGRTAGSVYSGGFIGVLYEQATINKCLVSGAVVRTTQTIGGSYIGGFAGALYDNAEVSGSYVEDTSVSGNNYVGGFSGAIYNYLLVNNCYSNGGYVTCAGLGAGGFSGLIYNTASISNCYAQTDVFTTSTTSTVTLLSGNGGFVGCAYDSAVLKNCYATGSVTVNGDQYTGSFAGQKFSGISVFTNCYGTGTVTSGNNNNRAGGFSGNVSGSNVENCFYDTTTTRLNKSIAVGSNSGITGISTTSAIKFESYTSGGDFSTWNVAENTRGKAIKKGDDNNPWYIDDGITYPYFFYQYDRHTKEDVNYDLAALTYSDGVFVAQKRSDFTISSDALPLKAKSAGGARAYFPYLDGTSDRSMYDINTSEYTEIKGAVNAGENVFWSLGCVSKTGIIAFANIPEAVKSSSRRAWNVDDEDTYTYVGDTVTYQIDIYNYSTEADYIDVVVQDYLPTGVSFIENSVKLLTGNDSLSGNDNSTSETIVPAGNVSERPSYDYDSLNRILSVYLNNMEKVSETVGMTYCTITFDVYVKKEAASSFHEDKVTYDGHIRNYGVVTGKLKYSDTDISGNIEVPFDDENYDPVYNVYLFDFLKTDEEGIGLKGAEFSLYYWNGITNDAPTSEKEIVKDSSIAANTESEGWILHKSAKSGDTGLVPAFQLKYYPGYYQLVETTAPPGYKTPTSQWRITVSENAAGIIIETKNDLSLEEQFSADFIEVTNDSGELLNYQLVNVRNSGSITIEKYGINNEPLKGAGFAIARHDESNDSWIYIAYDSETSTWYDYIGEEYYSQKTQFSEDNRIAFTVFENLPIGNYKICEVTAPNGYSLLINEFEASIPTGDTSGKPVYDITVQVYDSPALKMPQTGRGLSSLQIIAIGFTILIIAVAGGIFFKRRKLIRTGVNIAGTKASNVHIK